MNNKLSTIFAAFLLIVGVAFSQTANVTKGSANNNLTGALNTGTQTITANDGGTITYSGTGAINAKTLQGTTPTAAGLTLLDDASASAQRTTLVLGNVDNTSDANKPISTATQTALDLKATVANPSFTGTLTIPLTTGSSVGVIKQGSTPIIHNYSAAGTSGGNFFVGPNAGNFTLSGTGDQASFNEGFGFGVLSNITTGFQNTVMGYGAANGLTTAYSTVAIGNFALNEIKTNDGNTAVGNYSQKTNAAGRNNTSVGEGSMRFRTAGDESDALGHGAGYYDDTGSHNLWLGATTGPTIFGQGITNSMALGWQTVNNASNTGVIGNLSYTDFYFGGAAGLAKLHGAKGYFSSAGSSGTLVLEPTDAGGTAQYYARGTASSGALDLWRIIRGNGAGGGLLDNGFNLDTYGGFQVRANHLGGSGDNINLLGAPVTVDNPIISSVTTGTAPFQVASLSLVTNLHAQYADSVPASGISGNTLASNVLVATISRLTNLSSNGLVKTSGGTGDLSVDTTTYVPASGGTLTSPTIATGITPTGSGLKHSRVTTGSVSGGSTALVTVTWGTAFADSNYTVEASVVDSTTSSLSLSVVHVESITASAVTVRVLNNAIGALTGTLHVTAIHD